MDSGRVVLIICLTIIGVVVLNAVLYLALRRGQEANMINLLRKAAERARDPWNDEVDALEELSRLVADLRQVQAENVMTTDNGESTTKGQE